MIQPLPYNESEIDKNAKEEEILNTPDDSDIGYFSEVGSTYPDIKKKPICS